MKMWTHPNEQYQQNDDHSMPLNLGFISDESDQHLKELRIQEL